MKIGFRKMRVIFHKMGISLNSKRCKNKILVHLSFLTSSNPVFSFSSQCQARVHGGIQQTVVSSLLILQSYTADQDYLALFSV